MLVSEVRVGMKIRTNWGDLLVTDIHPSSQNSFSLTFEDGRSITGNASDEVTEAPDLIPATYRTGDSYRKWENAQADPAKAITANTEESE